MKKLCVAGAFIAATVLAFGSVLSAQFQMPDPKQMSGIPRPDGQMSSGAVSVRRGNSRLIRS